MAFNRTSMESKQIQPGAFFVFTDVLLIEPVWNRNSVSATRKEAGRQLLIEPVWNRNRQTFNEQHLVCFLLIEPVWNRN